MATSIRKLQPRRRRWTHRIPGPSVREVCLVGLEPSATPWAAGDRIEYGGRAYRVAESRGRAGGADSGTHYVHLRPEADDSSVR